LSFQDDINFDKNQTPIKLSAIALIIYMQHHSNHQQHLSFCVAKSDHSKPRNPAGFFVAGYSLKAPRRRAFPRAIPEEGIAGGKQNDISLQPVNHKKSDRGSASPAPAPL